MLHLNEVDQDKQDFKQSELANDGSREYEQYKKKVDILHRAKKMKKA